MKAERSKLVTAISSSATEQSIKIKSEADKEASKLLADADAKAKEIRGEGQQAMVQSLQVMAQRPEFAKFLMDLDMMEELSKDKTTWILDHNTTGLELLQSAKPPGESPMTPSSSFQQRLESLLRANPPGAATNAPAPVHN
jgi:regulator of protease activity HflC (stomatin/prohibitin superfamily)